MTLPAAGINRIAVRSDGRIVATAGWNGKYVGRPDVNSIAALQLADKDLCDRSVTQWRAGRACTGRDRARYSLLSATTGTAACKTLSTSRWEHCWRWPAMTARSLGGGCMRCKLDCMDKYSLYSLHEFKEDVSTPVAPCSRCPQVCSARDSSGRPHRGSLALLLAW